jgi:hypothetical protein
LKERFATLQIGPESSVVFDYKEDEHAVSVKGMYTMGAAAKCLPGPATHPYPAELVIKLEVGDGKTRVLLCFDNKEERDSFETAVEFGLNSENYVKAYLSKKKAEKSREEAQRALQQEEEKAKMTLIQSQIAQNQHIAAENQAMNAHFEEEQQQLTEIVSQLKDTVSAEKQQLEEEQSALRAAVQQDLLNRKLSLDAASERAKGLVVSNIQASRSLTELESSIDSKFAAFRQRENSCVVVRAANAEEFSQRVELERLHMLALQQEELERQSKSLAEERRKDLELAGLLRVSAESAAPHEKERCCKKLADPQHVCTSSCVEDAGTAAPQSAAGGAIVKERLKLLSMSGPPHVLHATPGRQVSLSRLSEEGGTIGPADASAPARCHSGDDAPFFSQLPEASAAASAHPVGETVKERMQRLSIAGAAVASLQPAISSSISSESEVIVPVSQRCSRRSLIAASAANIFHPDPCDAPPPQQRAVRRPSLEEVAIPLKERLRLLTETETSHSGSAEPPQQKELLVDGVVVPVKERLRHLSLSQSADGVQQKPAGKQPLAVVLEKDAAAS